MTHPSRQVCIATGQNLANLIPAIQLQAAHVTILETPDMTRSARNLKTALESRGIEAARIVFDDATPETIRRSAEKAALDLGEAPLVLNVSGGHKLITLALTSEMQALAGENLHLLYCETRYDRLDWLHPAPATEPMESVLRLEDILLAQGYRIRSRCDRDVRWTTELQSRSSLTFRLGDGAEKLASFFGTLNGLADDALNEPNGPFRPQQDLPFTPGGRNADLLRQAQDLELLHWDNETEVVFRSEAAARYFRGGWLEEYAWLKLRGLGSDDLAAGLEIESVAEKTVNELDVVAVHRNRLLVIECKTGRLGRDGGRDADYIYKLAQLTRQVGGLMARGLMLSARPASEGLRFRAMANQVDVLAGREVAALRRDCERWMAGAA